MSGAMSWDEVYRKLFAKVSLSEKFFRDQEYAGYRRTWATWPMLEKRIGRRRPTEYQVVSYALEYWGANPDSPTYRYLGAPFELGPEHHIQKWYKYFRDESPIVKALLEAGATWDNYEDPHQITYWKYNSMMDEEEVHVDRLLEEIVESKYDWGLSETWLDVYRDYYDPLRFLWHALQMHAAYLSQMAPTSAVTNIFTFMAMDHMRRVQRIAQRIKMLDIVYPDRGFGTKGRSQWEEDPVFQPARQAIEQMLVAYDYTEALVSYGLAVKPVMDELLLVQLGRLAEANGDPMMRHIHHSFYRDTQRHRDQIAALFRYAFEAAPSVRDSVRQALDRWMRAAYDAATGFKPLFEEKPEVRMDFGKAIEEVREQHMRFLSGLGL